MALEIMKKFWCVSQGCKGVVNVKMARTCDRQSSGYTFQSTQSGDVPDSAGLDTVSEVDGSVEVLGEDGGAEAVH